MLLALAPWQSQNMSVIATQDSIKKPLDWAITRSDRVLYIQTKWKPLGLKTEFNMEVPKTALPQRATCGWLQKQVSSDRARIKMPNFTAEINMFTSWYKKKCFALYVAFMTTGVNF